MNVRRAFTLIELLVVIAIIAILASILFPVFAQAKSAAKDTVALSNAKECGLAELMYASDTDDTFPLCVFGSNPGGVYDSWQGLVQPYMKNWGVETHPKVPALPANQNSGEWYWQVRMHWGMPLRAASDPLYTNGYYNYVSGSMTQGIPTEFDGIGGDGCKDPITGNMTGGYCLNAADGNATLNVPSLQQTAVNNIADVIMVTEANDPDMSWIILPPAFGGTGGPLNYWLMWIPGTFEPWGAVFTYCGPHARKSPQFCDGSNNGVGGIQSICAGGLPWPDGRTTYVACDGHAQNLPWRGGITAWFLLSNGNRALKHLWPN